jgi:hypothetical protein
MRNFYQPVWLPKQHSTRTGRLLGSGLEKQAFDWLYSGNTSCLGMVKGQRLDIDSASMPMVITAMMANGNNLEYMLPDNMAAFLQMERSTILYQWEMFDKHSVLHSVLFF